MRMENGESKEVNQSRKRDSLPPSYIWTSIYRQICPGFWNAKYVLKVGKQYDQTIKSLTLCVQQTMDRLFLSVFVSVKGSLREV